MLLTTQIDIVRRIRLESDMHFCTAPTQLARRLLAELDVNRIETPEMYKLVCGKFATSKNVARTM